MAQVGAWRLTFYQIHMKTSFEYLTEFVEPDDFYRWEDVEIFAFTDLGIKVAINGELHEDLMHMPKDVKSKLTNLLLPGFL